jgi:glycosyltransferase involved in cell wall biosynthesis
MIKILFLIDNPYSLDRRVMREAEALNNSENFKVLVLALRRDNYQEFEILNGVEIYRIFGKEIVDIKNIRAHKSYAQKIVEKFEFNIIHAHDQVMLNIAIKIKKITNKKVIYDSHELFRCWPMNTTAKGIRLLKSKIVRGILINREAKNFKYINGLITVNQSIRKDLESYFNLNIPTVSIRNIPELPDAYFQSDILRKEFNISPSTKLLVYIGNNVYPKTINIEQVIDNISNKENTVFVIIARKNLMQKEVEKYVQKIAASNIFFRDVVPPNEIVKYLSSADVGVVPSWNKVDLSYWYGLDNKLFEYMMSEIPILATKQPEYIQIVEKNNIGECINPEIDDFYAAFNRIIKNKNEYKLNIQKTKKVLNWPEESKLLLNFYNNFFR